MMINLAPLLLLLTGWACAEDSKPAVPPPPAATLTVPEIAAYDLAAKSPRVVKLPKGLREISGLAFTEDDRLLCHNDEAGIVFEVDYRIGKIVKRFYLGRLLVRGDFEGIAARRDTVFLVDSGGTVYRFRNVKDGQHAEYQRLATPLHVRNDVEGLTYDPETDCLLLACKGEPGRGLSNTSKAVYAFSLKTRRLEATPRFVLALPEILPHTGGKEFNPSAIERHPITGNFFVLAFNGMAIVELDRTGKLLGVTKLPKSVHSQPEGLAIARDGTLIIANEGQKKAGTLVIYSPKTQ